jgi:hypothetical protein
MRIEKSNPTPRVENYRFLLLPNIRRSNSYSPLTSTSEITTANILIVDIDSRYPVGHAFLLAGAESVPKDSREQRLCSIISELLTYPL